MGTIHEYWTLCSSYDRKTLSQLRSNLKVRLKKIDNKNLFIRKSSLDKIITPITSGLTNGMFYFTINPDNSKEGFDINDFMTKLRISCLRLAQNYNTYADDVLKTIQVLNIRITEDGDMQSLEPQLNDEVLSPSRRIASMFGHNR